jgi:hypothetical protein
MDTAPAIALRMMKKFRSRSAALRLHSGSPLARFKVR